MKTISWEVVYPETKYVDDPHGSLTIFGTHRQKEIKTGKIIHEKYIKEYDAELHDILVKAAIEKPSRVQNIIIS